jgi:hypothetical protein
MKKTEEFNVLGVIAFMLALLLVFCLSASDILAFPRLGLIGVLLELAYARYVIKERIGPSDERSRGINGVKLCSIRS